MAEPLALRLQPGPLPPRPAPEAGPRQQPGGAGGCSGSGGGGWPGALRDGARRPHPEAAAARGQRRGLLRRVTDGAFEPRLTPTVVYDVTRKATFTGLGRWLSELEMYATSSSTVKMLLGNKTDKPDREVERKEGLQLARKHSLLFIETSAKTQDGVHHAFEELVLKILQTPDLWDKGTGKKGVQLTESSAQQNKGFCGASCALI
ncbi:ras-related protein Rab-18-B-like isoform X3 [Motacilla alba alba]|uniref:ras-related protein Rab-18-B-like isoform X3 n=1 Tax=Motacilla alba alba TaxID=1094192 RepID=UPI0018D5767B|nr:ras-related protein Rab-18-B-like isoform X3 [Motacilla alba alba]